MRIAIAEDSAVLREGLAALLTRRGHEPLAVPDGDALLQVVDAQLAAGRDVDAAVIDIRMPPTFTDEGLQVALRLRGAHPQVGVLLFSQYIETRYAAELLAGDARGVGYLLKDRVADVSEFLDALARIAAGHTVLDPEVVAQLMAARREDEVLGRLTAREREVLELMAQGRSNAGICEALFLSQGAVEKHITSIFAKLNLAPDLADHRRVLAVLAYVKP